MLGGIESPDGIRQKIDPMTDQTFVLCSYDSGLGFWTLVVRRCQEIDYRIRVGRIGNPSAFPGRIANPSYSQIGNLFFDRS